MTMEFDSGRHLGRSSVGTVEPNNPAKGYFIGHFVDKKRSEYNTDCEIAVLQLSTVDGSRPHFHERMTEITYVASGKLELLIWDNGGVWGIKLHEGQYLLVEPGVIIQNPKNEEGTRVFIVKFPSIPGDKKYIEQSEIDNFLLSE